METTTPLVCSDNLTNLHHVMFNNTSLLFRHLHLDMLNKLTTFSERNSNVVSRCSSSSLCFKMPICSVCVCVCLSECLWVKKPMTSSSSSFIPLHLPWPPDCVWLTALYEVPKCLCVSDRWGDECWLLWRWGQTPFSPHTHTHAHSRRSSFQPVSVIPFDLLSTHTFTSLYIINT